MKKLPSETIGQIVALKNSGCTQAEIAHRLALKPSTVEHALRLGGAVKKRLTDAQRDEMCTKRQAGVLVEDLAREYSISRSAVTRTTKDVDLSHLRTDVDGVIAAYNQGLSHTEIGEHFGLAKRSVESVLARHDAQKKRMGVEQKTSLISGRKEGATLQDLSRQYGLTVAGVKGVLHRNKVVLDSELKQKNITDGRLVSYLAKYDVKTHDELMHRYAVARGGRFKGYYVSASLPVEWECSKGHLFQMRPNSVQQGQWCPQCAHVGPSKGQLEVYEYVKGFCPDALLGDRTTVVNPGTGRNLELDIYVPSKKFAFEYNGLIFHSDYFENQNGRHYTKAMSCREAGISLLAIFEDEWLAKPDLIKAMIRHRLGVLPAIKLRASKCEVRKLTGNHQFKEFFERNHLDGHARAKYAYGLFLEDRLLSCLSVRINHQKEVEIARFATDYDVHVYGGAGKLITAALVGTPKLITFSNNRLSTGNVYLQLGAVLLQENKPSYWYTDGEVRVWRYKCKRINDPDVLARFPEVPHTEKDQARQGVISSVLWGDTRPLYKIEDYGHRKWLLTSPTPVLT